MRFWARIDRGPRRRGTRRRDRAVLVAQPMAKLEPVRFAAPHRLDGLLQFGQIGRMDAGEPGVGIRAVQPPASDEHAPARGDEQRVAREIEPLHAVVGGLRDDGEALGVPRIEPSHPRGIADVPTDDQRTVDVWQHTGANHALCCATTDPHA